MYYINPDYPLFYQEQVAGQTLYEYSQDSDYETTPEYEIIYKFNKLGYRCDEIENYTDDNFILSFGCSYTEGVGIRQKHTWIHRLADRKGLPYFNAAKAGTGIDFQYYNALFWAASDLPKPKVVIVQWPEKHRMSFGIKRDKHMEFVDMSGVPGRDGVWWSRRYIQEKSHLHMSVYGWIESFNHTWAALGVPVLNFSWDDDLEKELIRSKYKMWHLEREVLPVDKARDNAHPGPKYHMQTTRALEKIYDLPNFTYKV